MTFSKHFLSMEITKRKRGCLLSKYVENFQYSVSILLIVNDKPIKTDGGKSIDPTFRKRLVKDLLCMLPTRPDIIFNNLVSEFIYSSSNIHFDAANMGVKIFRKIMNYGINFEKNSN